MLLNNLLSISRLPRAFIKLKGICMKEIVKYSLWYLTTRGSIKGDCKRLMWLSGVSPYSIPYSIYEFTQLARYWIPREVMETIKPYVHHRAIATIKDVLWARTCGSPNYYIKRRACDGWMDRVTGEWMDGWMGRWMDGCLRENSRFPHYVRCALIKLSCAKCLHQLLSYIIVTMSWCV